MTFREIEKILRKDGWSYSYAKGSHYHYVHSDKKRRSDSSKT